MKKMFRIILAGVAIMSALTLGGCGSTDVAMTVNGIDVPQGVVNYYTNYGKDYLASYGINVNDSESGAQYMSLIEEQAVDIVTELAVIRSMAADRNITVTAADLKENLETEKGYFESDTDWKEWLTSYQIDEDDVEWIIEYQLLSEALYQDINSDLTLTDEEVAAIYDADPESYDTYKYAHILITPEDSENEADWDNALSTAQSAIAQLNDGTATFEALAAEYNPDSTSSTGGDLGQYITKKESPYVQEFSDAAFALTEIGQITTEPVKSDFGYHIIKLLDATTGVDAARDAIIEQELGDERYNRYSAAVEEALSAASITKDYQRQYAVTEDDVNTDTETETETDAVDVDTDVDTNTDATTDTDAQ